MMKLLFTTLIVMIFSTQLHSTEISKILSDDLHKINNFHFVSTSLASSGLLKLDSYKHIQEYGFKHVINLIPGHQTKEQNHVKSLGLSYEQIEVDFSEPTIENFENFIKLVKSYNNDKIYVHCEANFRASTFLYLYRVTQLGISQDEAKKDLLKIWRPSMVWADFIEKILFNFES
jgi:protein tyrosine phosphatase (PTP) superfamily phosphohydrolase (DUF442 family)